MQAVNKNKKKQKNKATQVLEAAVRFEVEMEKYNVEIYWEVKL